MAKGDLLGRIDCPCCGTGDGMRVTEDKNGHPFGYCDATCNFQFRVGGNGYRVEQFFAKYPHLKGKNPVTVTVTEKPVEAKIPVTVTVSEKPVDYLSLLGVRS